MDFNEYQKKAKKTALFDNWESSLQLSYLGLGVAGEAGEVAEKIKKILRDYKGEITPEKKQELVKEMGDVLWYLSQLARILGVEFEEVAKNNIEKLYSRLDRGTLHGEGDNR